LARIGTLPREESVFDDRVVRDQFDTVVYADQVIEHGFKPACHHVKTLSVYDRGGFKMSYDRFLAEQLSKRRLNMVLDTFHAIEWRRNMGQDASFEGVDCPREIGCILEVIGCITEVHLADAFSIRRRNVSLGTGLLNLPEIARAIKSYRFNGILTPEVSPATLLVGRGSLVDRLKRLKDTSLSFFR
jgi:hypothetical protein